MYLSEINVYPVKSLGALSLRESLVEKRGLAFDRRWMLVTRTGEFLTQREFPKMAALRVELRKDSIAVQNGKRKIDVPLVPKDAENVRVKVWRNSVTAAAYPNEVNHWFSDTLGTECRLVHMPETTERKVNPRYAMKKYEDTVSFADGYPFLLIGESSLKDLNSRLKNPIPMNRFRPNFVVSGAEPFAEDKWGKIRIGETVFHVVKPCGRCVVTTVDQVKGVKTGGEPLRALATYRKKNGKLLFGQNMIADAPGARVRVGDAVEILERL